MSKAQTAPNSRTPKNQDTVNLEAGECVHITCEEKYRTLIEATGTGYCIITPHQGIVVEANSEYLRLTGRQDMDEIIGHSTLEWTAPHDRERNAGALTECMEHGILRDFEIDYLTPAEEINSIEINAGTIHNSAGGTEILALCRNITKRKQTVLQKERVETQNRQLHKAESLSRMAGAIAHEFNNQLQTALMCLEMCKEKSTKDAFLSEQLTTAMHATQKAAEVSSMMLTYLGQTFVRRKPMDIAETCLRCLPIIQGSLPMSADLITNFPSPGPLVHSNEKEVMQVLGNLISNACEANGGTKSPISLSIQVVAAQNIPEAHRYPVEYDPENRAYACLEISDTGSGITKEDIENIFDPFFSRKFTGRGLGLNVVLGILKASAGFITVQSSPNQGSTFQVFLPILLETINPPTAVIRQHAEKPTKRTVLVVDDEPMLLKTVSIALKKAGYSVFQAEDGVAAVELFSNHQQEINCVLCDLKMPRMDGWETLSAIRKLAPDIPVILTSGYTKEQVIVGNHPELPQAFLTKPYSIKTLLETTAEILYGQTQR